MSCIPRHAACALPMIAAAGIPKARIRTYFMAAAKTAGFMESFPMIAARKGRAKARVGKGGARFGANCWRHPLGAPVARHERGERRAAAPLAQEVGGRPPAEHDQLVLGLRREAVQQVDELHRIDAARSPGELAATVQLRSRDVLMCACPVGEHERAAHIDPRAGAWRDVEP